MSTPIVVIVSDPPDPLQVVIEAAAEPAILITITEAPAGQSAYEAAVAGGFEGTQEEWLASLQGPQVSVLTLAEYLALDPEVQMDGTWYVIPKT